MYTLLKRPSWFRSIAFGAVLLVGTIIGWIVPSFADQNLYRLIMIGLGLLITLGLALSGNPRRILLMFLVLTIPMDLAFSPFGKPELHAGGAEAGILLYLYDLPLLGLFVLMGLATLRNHEPIHITTLDVFAGLFILWSLLTIYNSTDITLSLFEVLRMVKLYLLARVVAGSVNTRSMVRDLILASVLALFIQAVISVLQYAFGFDLGGLGFTVGDLRRVSGTVGWPNTFGAYIAAVVCVPLALWMCGVGGKFKNLILLVVCIIGFIPLLLTFSRGAWVGMLAAVITIAFLGRRAKWLSRGTITRLLMLVAVIAVIGVFFFNQIAARFAEDTLAVRGDLNRVAFNMIEAQPLLGIGLNTFVPVMRNYDTIGVTNYFAEPVHNVFLLIAAESGLVGLGLFLLLIALIFAEGLRAIQTQDRFLSATAIGLLGGMVVILVSNLTDVHLKTDVIFALFWFVTGWMVALRRMAEAQTVQAPAVEAIPLALPSQVGGAA